MKARANLFLSDHVGGNLALRLPHRYAAGCGDMVVASA
jgi:hypothetical protein